jgi:hypothetical protein
MINPNAAPGRPQEAVILRTQDERELDQISNPSVQAVIFSPPSLPAWFEELAVAVQTGAFQVPRNVLANASRDDIAAWLDDNLPVGVLTPEARAALTADILALVDRVGALGDTTRFMLRIFTGVPNTECGFHLDTVPPGRHPCGLLRVYSGAGTAYVEPSNVSSMAKFYCYLSRRERLTRDRATAHSDGDTDACMSLEREIERLDTELNFLLRPDEIHTAPAGTIVGFKHLDVRLHWSDHDKSLAWIHCSPMNGEARLVVNVTANGPARLSRRRGTGAIAR